MRIISTTAWVLALAAALGGGCTRPAGVIFDPANRLIGWPPPPDEARIFYLGQIRGSGDLKPARRFGQRVGDVLLGKEAEQGFVSPLGVCTDGADRVFVVDSNAQMVHVLNLRTRQYEQWRPPVGRAGRGLSQPVAVAFDPRWGGGRLLVGDSAAGEVVAFSGAGAYLGRFGAPGAFSRPCGIAVDGADGRVFVADPGAHQVVVLSPEGEVVRRLGGRGSGPGQFNFPTYVALDGGGRLYVSDSLNFRVQVFDGELNPVRQIGAKGDMPGYFSQPKGVSTDAWGHLYVVDANFEAVQVFSAEGTLLMSFGREGNGAGEFWLPAGIFVEPGGRIWVADSYNKRVQAFEYRPPEGER